MLSIGGVALGLVGVFCCLLSSFIQSKPLISPQINLVHSSKTQQLILLWAGQSALFLISLALFYFLEIQTQANARLHPVETAYFVQKIQQNLFNLGFFPWLIYSVLGIGIIYLSVRSNRAPVLSRAISWKKKGKLELFFHNMTASITEVVVMGPFILVTSLALIWFCEIVNATLKLDSLFSMPLRTAFICGLIIVVLRKPNLQLIDWMERYQCSVAKTLIVYTAAVAFFILWLHGFAEGFSLGSGATDPAKVVKSALAGSFSEEGLQTRIQLLILGWWCIWIPWMTSLIARTSVGFSILQAFLQSLILPLGIFFVVLPKVTLDHWMVLYAGFKMPVVQCMAFIGLIIFMVKAWGNMRTVGDVARGMMIPVGRLSQRSLKRWMHFVIVGLIAYIPGWMMLGWLPMQFFVTLNAIFMLVVVAFFLFAWAASLCHLFLIKKNKIHQSV